MSVKSNPMIKAMEQPKSMRAAITGNCFNCMGGTIEDEFVSSEIRMAVKECSSIECTLYNFRPWKRAKR